MTDKLSSAALDELAVIIREAQAIVQGEADPAMSLATIRQACHFLGIILALPETAGRITYHNGYLIERYAAAREALR